MIKHTSSNVNNGAKVHKKRENPICPSKICHHSVVNIFRPKKNPIFAACFFKENTIKLSTN